MKTFAVRLRSVLLVLISAAAIVPSAHAQTGTPQSPFVITSAPYVITKGGYYILGNNLNHPGTDGNIIDIQASNVTLDFNGFYIAGPQSSSNGVTGVYANERSNLTIKNGTIAYCEFGIYVTGNNLTTTNNVDQAIENMRVTYCYHNAIGLFYARGSTIANCKVTQTKGNYGIGTNGGGITVQGCLVDRVEAVGSYCISLDVGSFARGNSVSNAYYGVYGGKYQDNLTSGCVAPYSGGTDAGGNN